MYQNRLSEVKQATQCPTAQLVTESILQSRSWCSGYAAFLLFFTLQLHHVDAVLLSDIEYTAERNADAIMNAFSSGKSYACG